MDAIHEPTLRELIAAGAISEATALGQRAGFGLVVVCGQVQRVLVNKGGQPRTFASLDTLAPYLKRLGLQKFEVDVAEHQPGRLRPARPDRAAALKRTRTTPHQATLLTD